MNYRAILKVYKDERKLTDDETAFLNTLRKMNESEIVLLIESLSDKSQKKAGKKSASKSSGKSAKGRCQAELVSGATCNMVAWHGIHDAAQKDKYVESHEFLPAKSARASSLQQQISSGNSGRSPIQSPAAATVLDDDTIRCQFTRADNRPCHLLPDHNIHHLESAAEYHPFVLPA